MPAADVTPPSGTRDLFPADVLLRRRTFAAIQDTFERHGFEPLDTPAFERLDVLTGKYGEEGEQLIFRILRRGDHAASGGAHPSVSARRTPRPAVPIHHHHG